MSTQMPGLMDEAHFKSTPIPRPCCSIKLIRHINIHRSEKNYDPTFTQKKELSFVMPFNCFVLVDYKMRVYFEITIMRPS